MTRYSFTKKSFRPLLYAHSANNLGNRQPLADHLRNVASLAAEMATPFGGGDLAFLAGLWHDAGKADPTWQCLLIECEEGRRQRVGVDHKCAGVMLADETGGNAQLVGTLIHAHHGGLAHPRTGLRPWFEQARQLPGPSLAIEELKAAMPDIAEQPQPDLPEYLRRDPIEAEMFLRMTYSALVDADSLDTEVHFLAGASNSRNQGSPSLAVLWDRYVAFLADQPGPPGSEVNTVRAEVHEACIAAAASPQAIFRLTVPTGGGKTRSAMAFALRHGMEHNLRRIIVAVPFTSITQQTARVYREIFDRSDQRERNAVLEHHSGALEVHEDEGVLPEEVWRRLAAENWDAPIVVTTTVQLFESLFSNRRGKTRKLHNLAGSVIVLDEVQALPSDLLSPILDALRQMTEHYGATVVLSTATQPTFELIREFRELPAREINLENPRHFGMLRRVDYEWRTGERNPWPEVAEWIRQEHSALAIVNTRRHAMELLDALGDENNLHLSTLLCGIHRNEVLTEVRRRLSAGEPCRLVSTQVVEAGVDLDFPTVFRAEAPLDAVIQAAGRCNREGGRDRGHVVVFRPPDDATPTGVYRSGRDVARVVQQFPCFDPDDPETLRQYFSTLYDTAVNPDARGIQALRRNLDFPAVAEKFRMFEDDTMDLVVEYPPGDAQKINGLVEQLRTRERPARQVLRELQPHTISVHRREVRRLEAQGWIEPVMDGLGVWNGNYDAIRGIEEADPELIV